MQCVKFWQSEYFTRRSVHFCVLLILGAHVLLLSWSSRQQAPTIDEPRHLEAGVRIWFTGKFDLNRGNPPLANIIAAFPVVSTGPHDNSEPHTELSGEILNRNQLPTLFRLIILARWACIPFSILGGYACYLWARELYGTNSGLMALIMWCFCPNIITHGQLITADMAATSLGIITLYLFWKWLNNPSALNAMVVGFSWGMAELTKYVWVLLYLILPLIWLVLRIFRDRRKIPRVTYACEGSHILIMLLLSIYIINVGYAFEGSFMTIEDYGLKINAFDGLTDTVHVKDEIHRVRLPSWMRSIPVPLPENYIRGMVEISDALSSPHSNYLRGEWREGGWWYYYLYGLFVKLPVGTLILIAVSVIVTLWSSAYSSGWRNEVVVIVPMIIVLAFVTWATFPLHRHVRYALPVLPFAFVLASKTAKGFVKKNRAMTALVLICVGWAVLSCLSVYPYSFSYFNEWVGGPERGHEHLLHSNIDSGQDLIYLKKWLRDHPEAQPLYVSYFGSIAPRDVGIDFKPAPVHKGSRFPSGGPLPGWYALSVRHLYDPLQKYGYLLEFTPVARAGYSIYIYRLSLDDANRARRKLGYLEL